MLLITICRLSFQNSIIINLEKQNKNHKCLQLARFLETVVIDEKLEKAENLTFQGLEQNLIFY